MQSLLKNNYDSYPTELGSFLAPPNTPFTKETVTLNIERFLLRQAITMDGIEKIEPR